MKLHVDEGPQQDFNIAFNGQSHQDRILSNGQYKVEVAKITPKVQTQGRYEGLTQLEWKMRILDGSNQGLYFIVTSLTSGELAWTTDRLVNAIYPAIKAGQSPSAADMIGRKLEIQIKVKTNPKNGLISMYADTVTVSPYIELGSTGNLGDLGSNEKNGDVPF